MKEEEIVWGHLREVLSRFGKYFIERAKQNLLQDRSNASGTLVDSLSFEVDITDTTYTVTIELEDYWYYVNNGRKAGKFPPVDKIREWIQVKPVLPHVMTLKTKNGTRNVLPTVNQLAFLIGRKIANEGTEGTGFFDRAKQDTLDYFRETIEYAVIEDLNEYMENTLTPYYKDMGWN